MILIRRSLEIKTIPSKFCYNITRLSSSHSEKAEQPEENEGMIFYRLCSQFIFYKKLN